MVALAILVAGSISLAQAAGREDLESAKQLYAQGKYYRAARYAFAAQQTDPSIETEAYSWITLSLVKAGLYNASSYFFIRTLQGSDRAAVRRVLTLTQDELLHLGADLLRKYLVRHTQFDEYDAANRSAYLYALGKDALLDGNDERALAYLNGVSRKSPLYPFALQLRGTAKAILGKSEGAIADFEECVDAAEDEAASAAGDPNAAGVGREWADRREREARDLAARCQAGRARSLYQENRFDEADRGYDLVPKASFVWTDILFEQAWNAFGLSEFNRTLGKLVSYKSPGLQFVFNPEVDVLRAQTYLALCLYSDANDVVNEFNAKYARLGEQLKDFVESNANDLGAFFNRGKKAVGEPLHTRDLFDQTLNRFVRSPYFLNLVEAERSVSSENTAVQRFAALGDAKSTPGRDPGEGFNGFLDQVLKWRLKSIRFLGGAFVKNSLLDHHAELISDFEKMQFIKLEMLRLAKERLAGRTYDPELDGEDGRSRGNRRPHRKDDQYFWSFNGEFWNDELGDYVFGLESECRS